VYNREHSRVKTVTIAIPSLHRPDLTARCLDFIQQQTLPPDAWEAVVIENEALPDSILPDPLPPNTQRIELSTNEGTTGSINRAVAQTESSYVLLLNNDVEMRRRSIPIRSSDSPPASYYAPPSQLISMAQETQC